MSKDKLQLLSPLFLKYQADFEKNSRSKVFAPLAETYRKLGMTDKAMDILSQGIRFNPTYLMGYLGLAFCYFDIKQFNLAYSTLRPLVELNRDNIRLQKLFSDVCLELGKKEEALETLKYLLFINPRDKNIAELVHRVEEEVDNKYKTQHRPIIIPEKEFVDEGIFHSETDLFDLDKLQKTKDPSKNDFDDWMTVDLNQENSAEKDSISGNANYEQWNVKKGHDIYEPKESIESKKQEMGKYKVELNLEDTENEEANNSFSTKLSLTETYKAPVIHLSPQIKSHHAPMVTHTLVDLYCGQGHTEKALEVLEKILLLNPNDQKTINKIKEIQALVQPLAQYDQVEEKAEKKTEEISAPIHLVELTEVEEVSEEDGRRHLMSLIDEKIGPIEIENDNSKLELAQEREKKLSLFLKKIQKRALDYQVRV